MKYVQYADGWNAAVQIGEANFPSIPVTPECPYDRVTQRLSFDLWHQGFHDAVEKIERYLATYESKDDAERFTIESFQEIEE